MNLLNLSKARLDVITKIPYIESQEDLIALGNEIRMIFPKGMNHITKTMNRQSAKDLAKALVRFHEYYGYDYTKEEIIDATKKYIETKGDSNFVYRKCSKYFIIKDESDQGKDITSELETYISIIRDNDEDIPSDSWVNDLD